MDMRFLLALVAAATLFLSAHSFSAEAAAPPRTHVPRKSLEPFLEQYCIQCHGANKQRGQVRFDTIDWTITNNDTAQRWQDVLDQLNAGEMPPDDEPQPSNEQLSHALDSLTGALLKARQRLTDHGGEITMRRLNKREYANTIEALFGFQLAPDLIPDDGEAATFDTVGDEQYFTSSHFNQYLELGRNVAEFGFTWSARPHSTVTANRREPEERVTPALRKTLAELDEKMRMKEAGKTWQEMGFADEGAMKILFSQFESRAEKPRRYLDYPLVDSGIYMVDVTNESKRFGMNRGADPRASYRFRLRAGVVGDALDLRKFLLLSDNDGPVGVVKVKGTPEAPEIVELEVHAKAGHRVQSFHVEENRANIRVLDGYIRRLDPDGPWASIWLDWLEMEGPFYATEKPENPFARILYPSGPKQGRHPVDEADDRARKVIEDFAFEAFRRQAPAPEFVDGLLALFKQNRADGQNYVGAMTEVIAIILASPGFLYIQEIGETGDGNRTLSNRELAIRLAYFLWSAPPDEQLYAADLSDRNTLRLETNRLLDSPKAKAFYQGFSHQWADLKRFDAITVDETDLFRFNKGVRLSAAREVDAFFAELIRNNMPASNWIDSELVTINAVLAEHYGIPGVGSDNFVPVKLPADSPRGGLLGQTAFLTMGSNGERSSPVIRGALVMEKLLHDPPAPPPPNVPELGSASKTPRTNREMVEMHQHQAVCMSCHKKMDVIGFGLENFDTVGRWRETEKVGRKDVPIAPGGTLPNGAVFEDIQGLKDVLLQEQDHLARELIESLLAYGLGRTIEFSDATMVDSLLERLAPDNFRSRTMLHAIIADPIFRTK